MFPQSIPSTGKGRRMFRTGIYNWWSCGNPECKVGKEPGHPYFIEAAVCCNEMWTAPYLVQFFSFAGGATLEDCVSVEEEKTAEVLRGLIARSFIEYGKYFPNRPHNALQEVRALKTLQDMLLLKSVKVYNLLEEAIKINEVILGFFKST